MTSESTAPQTSGAASSPANPFDELRTRVRREVDDGTSPSAQIALAIDGELVLNEQLGEGTVDSRYVIFSCTKALAAAVIWHVVDAGLLSFSTRAADVLDGFGTNGKDQITVHQLLTHTAGLPRAPLGPPRWDTRQSRHDTMSGWRLNWEPGSRFEYHPTSSHWVLGEMVHAVTGVDIGDYARTHILDPLGLAALRLGVPDDAQHDILDLRAGGHDPSPEQLTALFGTADLGAIRGEVTPDALLWFNRPEVRRIGIPGGGGVSNAADLAMLYQAFLTNPGGMWSPEVLRAGTAEIAVTFPDPLLGHAANRSLGLVVAGDDGKAFMRGMGRAASSAAFGHNGAAGQIAFADPALGMSFVYLTNGVDRNFLDEARRTVAIATRAVEAAKGVQSTTR